MLFSSPVFIFYFVPLTLAVALLLRQRCGSLLPFVQFVSLASLFFYSYSNLSWLLLILGSISTNFLLGDRLSRSSSLRRLWLTVGVIFNLGLLGYFKYADFFVQNVNTLTGAGFAPLGIVLPIGISFYTFQQIAYLVDVYQEPACRRRFTDYLLFVSFFPQLIAGPIVHHKELIPQIAHVRERDLNTDLAIGLTLFFLGLTKKVLLADSLGVYANAYFDRPVADALAAWVGVACYSLQIYFDFSGYSDMALGLGRLFGFKLPVNFDSPYQARSIVEFWRRWHMTLSRFLRDYLYIPLGGSRHGKPRRYVNLMVTMLLGGLWHGAGWGFVVWGGLHGLYLAVNHMLVDLPMPRWLRALGWPLTLLAVIFAWVPFRAADLEHTLLIWQAMVTPLAAADADATALGYLVIGSVVALGLPNSQQLVVYLFREDLPGQQPHPWLTGALPAYAPAAVAGLAGFAAALGLALNNRVAEFLYFQF